MKLLPTSEAFIGLRAAPLWSLLAADRAPLVLALLSTVFEPGERSLPYAMLLQRLNTGLEELRGQGHSLPQTAKDYLVSWRDRGWLRRQMSASDTEEHYSLTTSTHTALRFLSGLHQPRNTATESRLSSIIQQVLHLADATNPDSKTRLSALEAERARIDAEIEAIHKGRLQVLAGDRALERIRDLLAQASDLAQDFHIVRDAFFLLNKKIRQRLLDDDGCRGGVVDTIFNGIDLIGESEAGRSFSAFWQLLQDRERVAAMDAAIEMVLSRDFAKALTSAERIFLDDFKHVLLTEAASVNSVKASLWEGLRRFVSSADFGQNRRLTSLIREAQSQAHLSKELVLARVDTTLEVESRTPQIRSISQHLLRPADLCEPPCTTQMAKTEAAPAGTADEFLDRIFRAEIDFRTLKENLRKAFAIKPEWTLPELLEAYPGKQGLGSVLGYISLCKNISTQTPSVSDAIEWASFDGTQEYQGLLPRIVFTEGHTNV